MTGTKITCPRCGRVLKSLGYARHRAMHYDADKLLQQAQNHFTRALNKAPDKDTD